MFDKVLNSRKKEHLEAVNLYLITDRTRFPNTGAGDTHFLEHVSACLEGGARFIQLRESRQVSTRRILSLAKSLRSLTQEFEALFIINERADIAKAVSADGVHLGPDDLDIASARKILGNEFIIGASVHTKIEAQRIFSQEVDYLTAGPVFASEMVPGQPAVGLKFLQWMIGECNLPWFAAGGIDFSSLDQVLSSGTHRIALTRCLMASKNPEEDTSKLIERLSSKAE